VLSFSAYCRSAGGISRVLNPSVTDFKQFLRLEEFFSLPPISAQQNQGTSSTTIQENRTPITVTVSPVSHGAILQQRHAQKQKAWNKQEIVQTNVESTHFFYPVKRLY